MIVNTHSMLRELEAAILARAPKLATQLRPGLSEKTFRAALADVPGDKTALLDLYTWHDGTEPLRTEREGRHMLSYAELSVVPGELLIFAPLELMLTHFGSFGIVAKSRQRLRPAVNRLFPFLWDGSTTWLAVDLQNAGRFAVSCIDFEAPSPIREVYFSFEDCLSDLVRTNLEGTMLKLN